MRTVLITGVSRDIGRATAVLAGARGWSITINYITNTRVARGCGWGRAGLTRTAARRPA